MNEQQFTFHTRQWSEETGYMSSPSSIEANVHFLALLAEGEALLPRIFQQMRDEPTSWVYHIYKFLPAGVEGPHWAESEAGRLDVMQPAWLAWGKEHGYLEP